MATKVRLTAPNGYVIELETDGKVPMRLAKDLVREIVKLGRGSVPAGEPSPLLKKLRANRGRKE